MGSTTLTNLTGYVQTASGAGFGAIGATLTTNQINVTGSSQVFNNGGVTVYDINEGININSGGNFSVRTGWGTGGRTFSRG